MIYTIGVTKGYLQLQQHCLEAGEPFAKGGRDERGPGGSVWRTRAEAQRRINMTGSTTHSVFGVDADWERDTEPVEGRAWRELLVDSDLILLAGD